MEQFRLREIVWRTALVFGSQKGCRPSPSIDDRLESIAKHDGVSIGPNDWPYYAQPVIVDDRYAACLGNALSCLPTNATKARRVLGTSAQELTEAQIQKLDELRIWCLKGGFKVYGIAGVLTILYRPGSGEEGSQPTL